jgi:signal peptidase I
MESMRTDDRRGMETVPPPTAPVRDGISLPRSLSESAVCLLLAVVLFRTFAAEGYMISTGSMAPHLLGYHKRVCCPTCKYEFPFGVAYDTDEGAVAAETSPTRRRAECPNCGQTAIDLTAVPRNHGDQLLVFKPAYGLRPPRRWEVVVFRNPYCPTEAYVKRVVGLPGEKMQIIDGDIYADGVLCRKDWAEQRVLRVPVYEHRFHPHDAESAWQPLKNTSETAVAWEPVNDEFHLGAAQITDDTAWSWVEFAHRVRQRGQHETSVKLSSWPVDLDTSKIPPAGLKFDAVHQQLSCVGVLSDSVRDVLLAATADDDFYKAVRALSERSHLAPVNDAYGYNPHEGDYIPAPVRDVMLSLTVQRQNGDGEFAVEMSDGAVNFTCVFDYSRQETRLYAGDAPDPVATGHWPNELDGQQALIEMSLFDQQVLVAVNGKPLLGPWTYSTPANTPVSRYPARFGARGLDVTVSDLMLYRDVYYTATRAKHAVQKPYQLDADELFVLGDNSPVSHDSRRWADGAVKTSLLVGKPFVVHLPSKPGRLRIGNYEMQLRLPDFSRMQFLR